MKEKKLVHSNGIRTTAELIEAYFGRQVGCATTAAVDKVERRGTHARKIIIKSLNSALCCFLRWFFFCLYDFYADRERIRRQMRVPRCDFWNHAGTQARGCPSGTRKQKSYLVRSRQMLGTFLPFARFLALSLSHTLVSLCLASVRSIQPGATR